jgi:hypothetical protein
MSLGFEQGREAANEVITNNRACLKAFPVLLAQGIPDA